MVRRRDVGRGHGAGEPLRRHHRDVRPEDGGPARARQPASGSRRAGTDAPLVERRQRVRCGYAGGPARRGLRGLLPRLTLTPPSPALLLTSSVTNLAAKTPNGASFVALDVPLVVTRRLALGAGRPSPSECRRPFSQRRRA